ncbi:MAG: ATP phosphoribosyltransferase regulatory subunit [Bordetella sp.]|nr:MAG: ATP phosphoribosyltransferase regulatory subunit [Bordetella sp.]
MNNWLLPENLSDELPAEARRTEEIRRKLLDLYRSYGFELVTPPLVEYIDSLLSAGGNDLDLRTCKLIDQLSGKTLGVRADITPQVSRIDSQLINRSDITRLCYCGSVLNARPSGLFSNRELLQTGAEIYGYAGIEADLEVIQLAIETLETVKIKNPRLDLCHLGIVRSILESDPLAAKNSNFIISLLREKNIPGLIEFIENLRSINPKTSAALLLLPSLHGGVDIIHQAKEKLPKLQGISESLITLQILADSFPTVNLSIDLADVGSYGYHSGVTFAFYADGWHDALVIGGRYDNVSLAFGRLRKATGFSLDLRTLSSKLNSFEKIKAISAPWTQDPILSEKISYLRSKGEVVIRTCGEDKFNQGEFFCDRELSLHEGKWIIRELKKINSSLLSNIDKVS